MPDSVTQIIASGPPGVKKNIAVLGDGFAAGATRRSTTTRSKELLIHGVFGHDYFYEDAQAFNVFRVNLISNESAVSVRVYDEHGTPTDPQRRHHRQHDAAATPRSATSSAARGRIAGSRAARTRRTLVQNALNTWVPDYDLVLIILNDPGFGGCGGGGFQIVPLGVELDRHGARVRPRHRRAGRRVLRSAGAWAGGEPGAVNLTINTNRATTQVGQFRRTDDAGSDGHAAAGAPGTPRARSPPAGATTRTSGCSKAAAPSSLGIYRPVDQLPDARKLAAVLPGLLHADEAPDATSRPSARSSKGYAGDFNGDGKDDVLVHNDNSIIVYRSERLPARRRVQRRGARARLMAVQARRPVLRRRLQRRRQGRGRRLQQHELGHRVPRPARRRRRRTACA